MPTQNPTLCAYCQDACDSLFSEACRLSDATASLPPSAPRHPSVMEFERALPGPIAQELLKNVKEVGCYICSQFWETADEDYRSAVDNGSLEGPVASYTVDIKPVGKKTQFLGLVMEYGSTRKRMVPHWKGYNEGRIVEGGGGNNGRNEREEPPKKPRGHNIWFELVPVEGIEYLVPRDTKFEDNTGSNATREQISEWLETCRKCHAKCRSETEGIGDGFPTRLVTLDEGEKLVKVVETSTLDPNTTTYLTLSHRWGTSQILTLTTKNFSRLQQGIPLSELPRTFQNALTTTLSLGKRYIWIDSLCIIQDSSSDWDRESIRMSSIYGNSLLTIAACHAGSSSAGCFSPRNTNLLKQCLYYPPENLNSRIYGNGPFYTLNKRLWGGAVEAAPLFKRGWVMQERILSRRMVFFAEGLVAWECAELRACESFPLGLPDDLALPERGQGNDTIKGMLRQLLNGAAIDDQKADSPPATEEVATSATLGKRLTNWFNDIFLSQTKSHTALPPHSSSTSFFGSPTSAEAYDIYTLVVDKYTSCDLTYLSDTLPAISGIATFLSPFLSSPSNTSSTSQLFLAGLWRTHFFPGLIWTVQSDPNNPITTYGVRAFPPSKYRAPTWSWASISGRINNQSTSPSSRTLTTILECTAPTQSEAGFGRLLEPAMLKLRGPLRQLKVYRDENGPLISKYRRPPKRPMYLFLDDEQYASKSRGVTWDVSWDERDLTMPLPSFSLNNDNEDERGSPSESQQDNEALYVTPILGSEGLAVGPGRKMRYRMYGIILRKVKWRQSEQQDYVRVGLLRLLSWEKDDAYFAFLCGGDICQLQIW